jgi:hypothetical protein
LGFDAGDSNLYRYVRNQYTTQSDPSGAKYTRLGYVNRTVNVVINISFYGTVATTAFASQAASAILSYWSGKGNSKPYDEWFLNVQVTTEVKGSYSASSFNNRIEVMPVGWDPRHPNDPPGALSGGNVSPGWFTDTGRWSAGADNYVIAHEAGHLFGFADYYTDSGGVSTPTPGYEGTIMAEYDGTATAIIKAEGLSFRDKLLKPDVDRYYREAQAACMFYSGSIANGWGR